MDEEALNLSVRKFLKKVGVTAQREIEAAVRDAARNGRLPRDTDALPAHATVEVGALHLVVVIEGELRFTSGGVAEQDG